MFARDRSDSNVAEMSALLLSVSLAVGGCEKRPDPSPSTYQPPSHATTFNPKTDEVASLPHAENARVIVYDSFEKLEISALSLQSMVYHAKLRQQAADVLTELVELDKKPGGVEKSGRKQEFIDRLDKITSETEAAEKSAPSIKIPDERNAFKITSSIDLRLTFTILSLADQTTPGWERANIPDGQLSEAGKDAEKLRDVCLESAKEARGVYEEFVPIDAHQPEVTFCLELAEAVSAMNKGLISVSSKQLVYSPLPETGMEFIVLSVSPMPNPTPQTWHGHMYVLGGGDKSDRGMERSEIKYPSRSVYVRMDDNNLIRVEQRGAQLYFSKNSAGYAQAGGELTILGTGGDAAVPLSNVYARVSYLEALAYLDGDWEKIYNGIREQQRSGKWTIDPALVKSTLEPLVTDKSPDSPPSTPEQFVTINYGQMVQVLPPVDPIPVYMRLKDSTLLKIVAHRGEVQFYRTSAGYAVAGGKVAIAGVFTAGADVPVSNLYTEITPNEALAYFDNDWHPIYAATAKQARALPNSVWPSVVLHALAPGVSTPKMYGVSFQGEVTPQIGPQ
jgi:hypothetical protein